MVWVVVILLLILAVLLFGAAAVKGALGALGEKVLGTLFLLVLIGVLVWLDINPVAALVLFFACLGVIAVILKVVQRLADLSNPPVDRDLPEQDTYTAIQHTVVREDANRRFQTSTTTAPRSRPRSFDEIEARRRPRS